MYFITLLTISKKKKSKQTKIIENMNYEGRDEGASGNIVPISPKRKPSAITMASPTVI